MSEGMQSLEVCARTGLTYRQLDHWVRVGVIKPSLRRAEGSGTYRLWSDEDVRILRVLNDMRGVADDTVDLSRLAGVVAALRCTNWHGLLVITDGEITIRSDLPDTHRPYMVVPLDQYLTDSPRRQFTLRNTTSESY